LRYFLEKDAALRGFFLSRCGIEKKEYSAIVQSQVSIDNGCIDIFFKDDLEKFAIVIENKIDSSFQKNQIKKYREYVKRISKTSKVIALIKNDFVFKDDPPDVIVYWFEVGRFIETECKRGKDNTLLLREFLNFLKEENMAIDKIGWTLLDGLKERKNLKNMLTVVLNAPEMKFGKRSSIT